MCEHHRMHHTWPWFYYPSNVRATSDLSLSLSRPKEITDLGQDHSRRRCFEFRSAMALVTSDSLGIDSGSEERWTSWQYLMKDDVVHPLADQSCLHLTTQFRYESSYEREHFVFKKGLTIFKYEHFNH